MKIFVTDAEYIEGKSGTGLRFTTNLGSDSTEFVWSIEGCLCFRNKAGLLRLLPPMLYIGARRTRYRNNKVSPALAALLEAALEREYGKRIKRNLTPGRGLAVRDADPQLNEQFELEV